jgi:hypothetical protein
MRCSYAHLDGAFVLGALAAAERAEYEQHLHSCDACSEGVRDLAGLPGLMSRVPLEMLEPPGMEEPPPETLLPSLVAEVRRTRRRTVRTVALAVAAAVVAVAGTVGVVTLSDGDTPPTASPPASAPTTAPSQEMESVGSGAVTGWVSLTEVPWGTRIDLTCTYGSAGGYGGYDSGGTTYAMVVHTTDGRTEQAGTWHAEPGRETHVSLATDAAPEEIASVEVTTADGDSVLRLTQ